MNKAPNGTILPDMFYVKLEHKDAFLKTVTANTNIAGISKARQYPEFLLIGNGRKCDFSGDIFLPEEEVYCVLVLKM